MKAVIFDLGRVLVGYDHQRTLEAIAECCDHGIDVVRVRAGEFGHDLRTGRVGSHGVYNHLVEQAGCTLEYAEFLTRFSSGLSRDDDALAYAIELQHRPETTVAVISNTNDGHVQWLDAHLPELKELDLVVMSNEVGMAKPDAAIFTLALELLDLPPQQAVFVDDLSVNVEAARALGMGGIVHVDWPTTRPEIEAWLAQ